LERSLAKKYKFFFFLRTVLKLFKLLTKPFPLIVDRLFNFFSKANPQAENMGGKVKKSHQILCASFILE
jgi:hypothetical protein